MLVTHGHNTYNFVIIVKLLQLQLQQLLLLYHYEILLRPN